MYEASQTLRPPKRTLQPLWRYLSAERLLDLLKTRELYFSHLPSLEDSLEGALTSRTREHMANWFQLHDRCTRQKAYAEVEEYQQARRYFYVNCWHMNDHESYLMWKAYAGRGFAIQTSFENMPYRDERKFRLVFWDVEPRNVDYPKLSKGVRVPVDVKMLIRGLVRSPYPEQLAPELEELIEQHGFQLGSSAVAARAPNEV